MCCTLSFSRSLSLPPSPSINFSTFLSLFLHSLFLLFTLLLSLSFPLFALPLSPLHSPTLPLSPPNFPYINCYSISLFLLFHSFLYLSTSSFSFFSISLHFFFFNFLAAIPRAIVALMKVPGDEMGYARRIQGLFVSKANELDR